MTIELIIQMIGSVGFPIAVSLACFWYINKQTTTHKEELQKVTDALNNNTLVIQRLSDQLGGMKYDH